MGFKIAQEKFDRQTSVLQDHLFGQIGLATNQNRRAQIGAALRWILIKHHHGVDIDVRGIFRADVSDIIAIQIDLRIESGLKRRDDTKASSDMDKPPFRTIRTTTMRISVSIGSG